MKIKLLFSLVTYFACLQLSIGQMDMMNVLPTNLATHTAVQNGSWFSASTWDAGNVPSTGAIVYVPNGITIGIHSFV